MHYKKIKD